jgi:hypothetical protein
MMLLLIAKQAIHHKMTLKDNKRPAADNTGLASGFHRASLQVSLPSISFVQGLKFPLPNRSPNATLTKR